MTSGPYREGHGVERLAPLVERREGTLGGVPVLLGTRLATRLIAWVAEKYGATEVNGKNWYPYLTHDQVQAAIEWEREHPTPPNDWSSATEKEQEDILAMLREIRSGVTEYHAGLLDAVIETLEAERG